MSVSVTSARTTRESEWYHGVYSFVSILRRGFFILLFRPTAYIAELRILQNLEFLPNKALLMYHAQAVNEPWHLAIREP